MKKWFGRPRALIPVLCYLCAVLVWLVLALYSFAADSLQRASGRLAEQELAAADFQMVDLAQGTPGSGGTVLQSLSGDPQMILEDVSGQTVRSLRLYADYDTDPREICLYYTEQTGQPYSQDRRVFPTRQADGSYLFALPHRNFVSLRLDPCSPEENKTVTVTLQKVILNEPETAARYFVPSWYQTFCLILYPGLAAAACSLLQQVIRRAQRPAGQKHGVDTK
jgi:hypothetical protein